MGLSVGTASSGNLSVGTNYGMQGGSAPQVSYNPQVSVSPQNTVNPQQTVDGGILNQGGYTLGGGGGNPNNPGGPGGPSLAQQQAAAAARAAAAVTAQHEADFRNAKGVAYGMIGSDQTVAGQNVGASVNDFLDTQRAGQVAADREAVQNALAEQQGRAGVLDMVGTGIRSGGVTLNNAGATNSSAAEALARAYGLEGRAQMTGVDNQYAQSQNDVANKEQDLATAATVEGRKLQENKATAVNNVVSDAVSRLAYLNQQAQYMSIPDRIAVDQEKQRIYDQTMGQLGQYDQVLSNGLGGIKPEDNATVQQKAHDLLTAGTAPASSFNYTTLAPASLQGTGPSASNLPIYTGATGKKTQTGV